MGVGKEAAAVVERLPAQTGVQPLIQNAYECLKSNDPERAVALLDEALALDFEHEEVLYAQKCLGWWLDKLKNFGGGADSYDRGGYILAQWKSYYDFKDHLGPGFDTCEYAIRRFVYQCALESFSCVLGDGVNQHDPGLLLQVGRCYKGAGDYEAALRYLEQAIRFKREDGRALSELADVNALLGETRTAKLLFREAFFVDPQGVDIRAMESELITRLAEKVGDMGYSGAELLEWIPVYGSLLGIFSVRRELKLAEVGRLNQEIWALEIEVRNASSGTLLVPRLVNKYLWLMDHYQSGGQKASVYGDTMLKIKILAPQLYERYLA